MIRSDYLPFGKPNISELEIEGVVRVMRSGWLGMGQETLAFESELASYLATPHVVAVDTCTSALFLALLSHGVGPGDEVIVPSLTWCATANAALYLGATPVFADVDADTFSLSFETIKPCISPRTKVVLPVHFGGCVVDVADWRDKLPDSISLVEDAAHALGSRYRDGSPVGSSGNLVCFSFYANKNLSTGEGGAIALTDAGLADHLCSLRQNAMPINAWNRFSQPKAMLHADLEELGYKMNYTDLNAAIGRVQLARQDEFAVIRKSIAQVYINALKALDPDIQIQEGIGSTSHARHLFVISLPLEKLNFDRDSLVQALRGRNIGASIHYPPLHTMPHFRARGRSGSLPVTERLGRSILTLPISASMSRTDAVEVALAFSEIYQTGLRG